MAEKYLPTIESGLSVAGGEYRDPDPNVVEYINKKFRNPLENTQATLMKAFEHAGVVKTIKEIEAMTEPLERSGLLPSDRKDSNSANKSKEPTTNEFTDRRDEQLLLELQEGNDARNTVLLKVIEMSNLRYTYGQDQTTELRAFGRAYTHKHHSAPPVIKITAVMVGITQPQDPNNRITSEVPELTREMATDVYWMILRDEEDKKSASQAVA